MSRLPRTSARDRFVTGCGQLLVLGVVVAGLTPAASILSLDVIARAPQPGIAGATALELAAVPTGPVEAEVTEVPLTAPTGARMAAGALQARVTDLGSSSQLVSRPQPAHGYAAVGVTWEHGAEVDDEDITLEVRSAQDGSWSDWTTLEYHDEHAPDPDSSEGRRARPGTDPVLVGEVDQVQVRVATEGELPADLSLAVIDPGTPEDTAYEAPAIDTAAADLVNTGRDQQHALPPPPTR